MAAAPSPPPASEPEKKHKKYKSEKKRARDEEDAPADERKRKKSKSAPQAVKLEVEPDLELKTEKKKKKKKRKEEDEEEEEDKKHNRVPELGEAPATESPKEEKHKKKHKEAGDGAEADPVIENEETEKKHKKGKHSEDKKGKHSEDKKGKHSEDKKGKHSEDTSAVDPKAGKKKHKRKHAENTSEANEAAAPAAIEHEAETKHQKSKHDEEAIANGDASVSKEGKKRHKKRHREADGETSAAAETPAVADEAVAEKKQKKKKNKSKDKDMAVADEAGDADAKKKKTKSQKHAGKDGENATADAMDVDEPGPFTSSKTYQPPDMPADPQFPFFSQTVSLYEPLYPTGWAQPVTNAQYQHLQHLLNKYVPSLRGVLLGYKNVAVGPTPGRDGAATDDEAPTTVLSRNEYAVGFGWITADVELFVPSRGAWMEGSVNLQTEGHIGLVCFGRFNASIEARRLPPAWKWVSNESPEALGVEETASVVTADDHGVVRQVHSTGFWVDAAGGRVRGRVRFRIRNFDAGASGDVSYLSLEGTMLDRDSEKRLVREEAFTAQMRREKRGGPRPERRRAPDFSMTRFADDAEPAQTPAGDGDGAT